MFGVHEDADGFSLAHGGNQAAGEVFVHSSVAMHGAIGAGQAVEIGIVKGPHHDV